MGGLSFCNECTGYGQAPQGALARYAVRECKKSKTPRMHLRIGVGRRKEIYEELHPETKHGANGYKGGKIVENEIISFSKNTAQKIGVSPRTVEQEIQIAKNLTQE